MASKSTVLPIDVYILFPFCLRQKCLLLTSKLLPMLYKSNFCVSLTNSNVCLINFKSPSNFAIHIPLTPTFCLNFSLCLLYLGQWIRKCSTFHLLHCCMNIVRIRGGGSGEGTSSAARLITGGCDWMAEIKSTVRAHFKSCKNTTRTPFSVATASYSSSSLFRQAMSECSTIYPTNLWRVSDRVVTKKNPVIVGEEG